MAGLVAVTVAVYCPCGNVAEDGIRSVDDDDGIATMGGKIDHAYVVVPVTPLLPHTVVMAWALSSMPWPCVMVMMLGPTIETEMDDVATTANACCLVPWRRTTRSVTVTESV